MKRISFKEASKGDWGRNSDPKDPATEKQTWADAEKGLLIRQTEAMELMATNHLKTEHDLKWWKDQAERFERENTRLNNEARSLRGVVTRFRNERDALKKQLIPTQ